MQLTPEQKSSFWEQFKMIDTNRDGQIDSAEMTTLLRTLGQNPSFADVQLMMNELDKDASGTINFQEFVYIMENGGYKEEDMNQSLIDAFHVFDQNNDGFIDKQEFKTIVTQLGESLSDDEFDDLMADVDADKDGRINFEEFVSMLIK